MQKKDCGPESISQYIGLQTPQAQAMLRQVYQTLRIALPQANEKISWGMPTFWQGRNIIHFAAAKKHIGIYPGAEAMEHFGKQLAEYKTSKGAWQIPFTKTIPELLLTEMAIWCLQQAIKSN